MSPPFARAGRGDLDTSIAVARSWARQLDLEIDLVHITDTDDSAQVETIRAPLDRTAGTLNNEGIPTTVTVGTDNSPAAAIKTLLHQQPGAIGMLTSHGRVGLARLMLGSVSSQLLESSSAPLLVIPVP